MFKLESYITPLLMGYLDKYVKLRQEDFQLSLWGGDAVLYNLDLRLDELAKVIQLPVIFQSGHIHELRLHVPWTKLGSEPVVITINTVECILKVRDTAYETTSSTNSANTQSQTIQQKMKIKKRPPPTEDLPPGYLQSIINRIINNVTFIINNLILKFVEDDIVLSVNIKSAECYSVDREWNRAFVDLTPEDLALRKVLNFADLTVCLDKTNSSGHIESYQEPVAYRCAVTCRLYMEYDSVVAKFPRVTRFNLYCDTLNLSLTDTQLPMLVRLIELCIAMYYGTLDIPTSISGGEATEMKSLPYNTEETGARDMETESELDLALDQGWVSWAWSYVPQILPTEEEEAEEGRQLGGSGSRGRPIPHILSLGFFIHQGTILFKLTEKSRESTELPHKKIHFHPFLKLSVEGLGIEVLLQGIIFCDIQCGITSFKLSTCGNCICGVPDEKIARCNTLLSGGDPLESKASLNYITNSLFDDMSWENRGKRSQHIIDGEEHRQLYTEQYALQRYGAFWVDSLYIFEKPEKHGAGSNSSETDNSEPIFQKELSTLRFVLGNTHLHVSSSLYHRLSKLIDCAKNHQYQPYSKSKSGNVHANEDRPKPTEEQVKSLEEFIPTNLLHLMVINPTVTILSTEHPHCDVTKKSYRSYSKNRDNKITEELHHPAPIPALVLSATRFDLQITKPMYPDRLIKLVTAIAGPSSNLLHHCHIHKQIKLFSFQAGLQRASWDGKTSRLLTLVPPCSFALYSRSLVLPKLWTNSSLPQQEWMHEVPSASLNVNKASVLLCSRVVSSWLTQPEKHRADYLLDDSLLDDLFPVSGESTHQTYPLLEIGLYGLEFKSCESALVTACVGSLSSFNIFLYTPSIGGKMAAIPIVYGPNDTSGICELDFFTRAALGKTEVCSDCITATFQKPKHTDISEAQALALVDSQGLCVWLDPALISWFHYCPQPRPGRKSDHPPVTLDLSLAQMTSPLNAMSNASVHSTSSPSHPGRPATSLTIPPHQGRPTSIPEERNEEKSKNDKEEDSLGKLLAHYFPLVRMLHVQVELKPSVIFLPKTSIPNSESISDILALVHQARHAGRLSDTVVICLPSIIVTSTMAKPMNVVQELPVTSIQGSLIGEKLPWTVKINNFCAYSLLAGKHGPVFFIHPMDILSTVAVNCKYTPPTSEIISTLALCLHVDVGQPKIDICSSQLQLFSTVVGMVSSLASNAKKLTEDCRKLFTAKMENKTLLTPQAPSHQKKSASSTYKIESIISADVTENITTDISEDFSHEGSPLHESIISDTEDAGVKLSLWLQLLVSRLSCTVYGSCLTTDEEHGVALTLDHFDLSMDSQNVYSKAKVTLGSISIQHSVKSQHGTWSWDDPEGIVLSCIKQLPHNLLAVTNKMLALEHSTLLSSAQSQEAMTKDKKKSVLSITFTRALCKNVKKRLRKANVDLPCVVDPDPSVSGTDPDLPGTMRHEDVDFYFHEYLSEVCVKTEPLDVVLKPEFIGVISNLIASLSKGGKSGKGHSLEIISETSKVRNRRESSGPFEPTSVHNLPLIYTDVGTIRIFIPKSKKIQTFLCPDQETLGKAGRFDTPTSNEQSKTPVVSLSSTVINIEIDPVPQQNRTKASQLPISSSVKPSDFAKVQTMQPISGGGISQGQSQAVPKPNGGHTVVKDKGDFISRTTSEVCSTLFHDMAVIQIKSCLMQPYADNPLPRIAQEKDVYQYAIQSGFTHQPGAVIEDRQYQIDIKGISFTTGSWDQVMHEMIQDKHRKTPHGSMVQIPALDWNTFLMDSPAQEVKDIRLIPVISPFDLCFVVAPPITYISKGGYLDSGEAKLICGFTSELNITSDLDLYLNTNQVKVLTNIMTQFSQFSQCYISDPDRPGPQTLTPVMTKERKSRHPQHIDFTTGGDSGVESDLSNFTFDLGQRHVNQQPSHQVSALKKAVEVGGDRKTDKPEEDLSRSLSVMHPLNILVTAGTVSCTVYTHKVLEDTVTLQPSLLIERPASDKQPNQIAGSDPSVIKAKDNLEHVLSSAAAKLGHGTGKDEDGQEMEVANLNGETTFPPLNFMKPNSEENLKKKMLPQGSLCIIPFFHVYLTQPHCIVTNHSQEEVKIEVSWYDIQVKAATDQRVTPISDYNIIPDSSDYSVHWLETRAGCPHPYTGIPPAFLTARFVKEIGKPDTFSVCIERPMRLKVTQLAVDQVAMFCSEITSIFGRQGGSHAGVKPEYSDQGAGENVNQKNHYDLFSLAEKLEVSTAQLVVSLELTDSQTCVGAVLSLEGVTLEADVNKVVPYSERNPSMTAHIHLKDIVAKTNYDRKLRRLIGPFTVNMDGLLSWIPLSDDTFIPQVLLASEFSLLPVTFGQEHMFCLSKLSQEICNILEAKLNSPGKCSETSSFEVGKRTSTRIPVAFVQDWSHDDLRCGGFQFTEQLEGTSMQPDVGEIVFGNGDPKTPETSFMSWHYPNPRVITHIHLTPVPFSLAFDDLSLSSSSLETAVVSCVLQYWDDLQAKFVDVVEFHLSENEPTTVNMPEVKPANASDLIVASIWRIILLQSTHKGGNKSKANPGEVAVLPSSLAACMCVDSASIPSLIPSIQVSLALPGAELNLCHHLKYNGSELPKKLSLYQMCPDLCEEQVFAVIKVENLSSAVSHVPGQNGRTNIKLSLKNSLDVLEYGHLTMERVLTPSKLTASVQISNIGNKQDINGNIQMNELRVKAGKSVVHTLNMAVAAWSTFNPSCSGSNLIFSYYILCNNTTSTIRFGQAGTDENIMLNSREMCAYSWRTYNHPQMIHLCMDKPSWKWTEPFPIDKESTSVRNVTARDQSYLVIIKVKRLANLQMQVTVFGQLIVSNRLSQPISMRISHSSITTTKKAKGEDGEKSQYIIQPGQHLPSLVSSEVLLNPVQFRLAEFKTSWSHDIFLSGDRMKDNQMVKIPLPDGTAYFHVWCRVFCQHFNGMPQKLIMLTPLYVVRTHLPHPLYIHLDSPKVKKSQEIMTSTQGQEFQLHCTGGDITHQMSFRLYSGMQLSSPAVVLSTGLIGQLTRSQVGSIDIEQICEQMVDSIHAQWPYLVDDSDSGLQQSSSSSSSSQINLPNQKDWNLPSDFEQQEINQEQQPSIDLNIRLSEYIPGCDTLLVEVSPAYLVHNATDIDMFVSGNNRTTWSIKPGHTLAPPLKKEEFILSIKYQNMMSAPKSVPMSDESMDYRRYNGDIGRVLFIDGYVHMSYQISLREANKTEMVFLTVTSNEQHGIRVICIRECFALSNHTSKNLVVKLLALPLSLQQIKMSETDAVLVTSKKQEQNKTVKYESDKDLEPSNQGPQPLFRWSSSAQIGCSPDVERRDADNEEVTFVNYIAFASSSDNFIGTSDWQWSTPVRIVSSKDGHRMTTSVPYYIILENHEHGDSSSQKEHIPVTHALCVVTQQVRGVTHIVVTDDTAPVCIVENLCSFPLQFGQTCDKLSGNDATVQEQVELVSDLPWVLPDGWCYYTPPAINSEFVAINIPRMHFRAVNIPLPESSTPGLSEWSTAIQISGNLDAFVRLPGFCDLKVLIQVTGMVTHLIVRPVSKAEVTAKEIRSRIMDSGDVKVLTKDVGSKPVKVTTADSMLEPEVELSESTVTSETCKDASSIIAESSTTSTTTLPTSLVSTQATTSTPLPTKPTTTKKLVTTFTRFSEKVRLKTNQELARKANLTFGVLCSSFTLTLQDESDPISVPDLVSVHFKDLFFACYPVPQNPDKPGSETSFAVCVAEAQIDNQQYGIGTFDFPVILLPQKVKETSPSFNHIINTKSFSVLELHALMKSKAFLHIQIVTLNDQVWKQSDMEIVDILVKPFSLYIDDTFIYRLVEELDDFMPSRLSMTSSISSRAQGVLNRKLPSVVKLNSYTLSHPIRVKHMTIQPIKMLLSVHASLKLFLASDHTPLSMSKFERVNVFSSFHQIAHALMMHYASAAVFRAGIVVGSLEILGNPTGLVRSIGTGVSDLISLPYSGLTRGPGAFVTGLSMGLRSLVKNVSAGMITSVTNFASSVSRNMDRLSFDTTHLERQEENRRNRPVGVSDGLKQGLTGFGISLLGAVAGLADQPIQTLLASGNQDKHRMSASSTASGLVTGVGKGLVGVFTKPIGGAAEFVSQTGQGILHGTGLAQLPTRLEKPVTLSRKELSNSQYKNTVKIFSPMPNLELLLAVPAVTFDLTDSGVKVELLLTTDVLVVVNVEEDSQQQAFTLSEVECQRSCTDEERVVLQWLDQFSGTSPLEQSHNSNKDRVAAFVDTQNSAGHSMRTLTSIDQSATKLYLDNQSEASNLAQNQSLSRRHSTSSQSDVRPPQGNQSLTSPHYEFQITPHLQELFLTVFRLAKNKLQGKGFLI